MLHAVTMSDRFPKMNPFIQSFKNGELWLAEIPVPAC